MILRRYGSSYQSVEANFNPTAMTEVGFRRDRAFSISVDEFEAGYVQKDVRELTAKASAEVQGDAERAVLTQLESALGEAVAGLAEGDVLVVLNGKDDHPKTRERRENVIVDGENRFHFNWWIDPPLKVAVFGPS